MRDLNRPTATVALHAHLIKALPSALWRAMASSPRSPTEPEKPRLRREALGRRAAESAGNGMAAGELVRTHGLALIASIAGGNVSGYLPIRDELTPLPLMQGLLGTGRHLCLPVIETKWAPLTFRAWQPGDKLVAAGFGLKEPAPEAELMLPDILLVPLAAFDAQGYRIGYGGGYYDRTLELYRASRRVTAIGIAYDGQEVPAFTHEPHDQRLDFILTPSGVRSFGR
jgi:5-formyltetrahydrofolate cyclo-ligase